MNTKLIDAEVATWEEWRRAFYEQMVADGQSQSMAHMLASRQAPRSMTDDVFLAGRGTLDQQIKDKKVLSHVVSEAQNAGYKPRPTDVYMSGMARFPGDPQAFFNHGEGLSKIREVCKERGVGSEGAIAVKAPRYGGTEPKRKHKLHPRIVERHRQRMLQQDPSLAKKDQRELRESIVEKHSLKEK